MTDAKDSWWRREPEFLEAQKNASFQAWVSVNDDLMEFVFAPEIVPELPLDIFSDEALGIAEAKLLEYFPTPELMNNKTPENAELLDMFTRYLGEVFVKRMECTWVSIPIGYDFNKTIGTGVEFPWSDDLGLFDIPSMVRVAIIRRTGKEWSFVVKNNYKRYLEWKAELAAEPNE